jgi:biopolymer transport protein TolR
MTPQRLRSKLRKIREQGEAAAEEGGELNIIPYLDIVVNIVIFMLATTSFAAALGDINVNSPSSGAVAASTADETPKNELNLTLGITEQGFTILSSGTVLHKGFSFDPAGNLIDTSSELPTIPKKGPGVGDYDYDLLAKKMAEIKASPAARDETKLIVNPNEHITYDIVVQALDASRGKLVTKPDPANPGKQIETFTGFPDVLFSAGVN